MAGHTARIFQRKCQKYFGSKLVSTDQSQEFQYVVYFYLILNSP
jgi:hypothetical protein